jgi:hypothetical protein
MKYLFVGGTADGARYDVPDNANPIRIPVPGIYPRALTEPADDDRVAFEYKYHVYEKMRLMNKQGTEFIVYLCNNV